MKHETPPLPTIQPIPKAVVEQWLEIPSEQDLNIRVSKTDIDNLFFSINNLTSSMASMQESIIAYSNGHIDDANMHMDLSKRNNVEALNALRSFMTSLMSNAIKNRGG